MRKVLIGLVAAVSVLGAAQAETKTGNLTIGDYAAEQNLAGSDVDEMWISAWRCYSDTRTVMSGAELKAAGVFFEDARRDLEMDEEYARLVKIGYMYEKPTDINIGDFHATCLNEAHRKITTK